MTQSASITLGSMLGMMTLSYEEGYRRKVVAEGADDKTRALWAWAEERRGAKRLAVTLYAHTLSPERRTAMWETLLPALEAIGPSELRVKLESSALCGDVETDGEEGAAAQATMAAWLALFRIWCQGRGAEDACTLRIRISLDSPASVAFTTGILDGIWPRESPAWEHTIYAKASVEGDPTRAIGRLRHIATELPDAVRGLRIHMRIGDMRSDWEAEVAAWGAFVVRREPRLIPCIALGSSRYLMNDKVFTSGIEELLQTRARLSDLSDPSS